MTSNTSQPKLLEAVYYATSIPRQSSLTFLGLVFDRVHFPNVYLPMEGFDRDAAVAERKRLEALDQKDFDTAILINSMRFLEVPAEMRDFCHFTGTKGQIFGGVDKEAAPLVKELDEAIFGPPPANFTPTHVPGFHKGLDGGEQYIDYPGPLYYPATAVLYAARTGLPLVNDQPGLPIPACNPSSARNNAKILSMVLAMECVGLILPKIRALGAAEIIEVRHELQPHLRPFRDSILELSVHLNQAIQGATSHADIQNAAQFIVEAKVVPALEELRATLEKPSKPWLHRAWDAAKQAPALYTAYASISGGVFGPALLAAIGAIAVEFDEGQRRKQAARSGLYYLLKASDLATSRDDRGT